MSKEEREIKRTVESDVEVFSHEFKHRFTTKSINSDPKLIFQKTNSINEIKENCLVVLDTNVLLLPYNTGKQDMEGIKRLYTQLIAHKRLVIPGQVAREFAKNRPSKISTLYHQVSVKNVNVPISSHPLLEESSNYKNILEIENKLKDLEKEYSKIKKRLMKEIVMWEGNDPITLLYSDLGFSDIIFDPNFDTEYIDEEVKKRQLYKMPPGYKDFSKGDNPFGDLIIWFTILEIAKKEKSNILFVSSDDKQDWWHRSDNTTFLERYELIDEFTKETEGLTFHIVPLSKLLNLFGIEESIVQKISQQEHIKLEDKQYSMNYISQLVMDYVSTKSTVTRYYSIELEFGNIFDFCYSHGGLDNELDRVYVSICDLRGKGLLHARGSLNKTIQMIPKENNLNIELYIVATKNTQFIPYLEKLLLEYEFSNIDIKVVNIINGEIKEYM